MIGLGDKFILEGTLGQVLYVNAGYSWLFPINQSQEGDYFRQKHLLMGVAFAKLDPNGYLMNDGGIPAKAYAVLNRECEAV